jgi:predicted AlkP superfamily pyrophosphatase or phosphodiesterase
MAIRRREFGACLLTGFASRALALAPRPKLLVLVIVEQFRPDYLDLIARRFTQGGFKRLMQRGAYFPDCRHLASTFSSSTIATLATGAWPSQHGIVADSWYDRAAHTAASATYETMLSTTLAAEVASDPRNRVYVVAGAEAHAGLFAGNAEARLYWIDDNGQFATSADAPDWMSAYNAQKGPEGYHNAKWLAVGAPPDAAALRTLSYSADRPREFINLYKSSHFAQSVQFDFAGKLIENEKMGQGSSFDFLCILSSSSALLGYEFGGRSPLMQQMAMHLDRDLEGLLNQLTKTLGENGFDFVFAGAHGAPPSPEPEARTVMSVKGELLAQAVDRSLATNGMGRVEKYLYPFLYLDTSGFRDPEAVRMAAARAALESSDVEGFFTAGGACSTHDDWARRFRNSFHSKRSGDVMLSYGPEFIEEYGEGRGVSYGSLYNYDVRVPLFFYGPQFRPGVYEGAVESVDVAPTLARVMGVAEPSTSTGRVLGEALAE